MDDPVHVSIDAEFDLHSFLPEQVRSVVEEYIEQAAQSGLEVVRIVHGRGRGVQRANVQATLERHPKVVEFWDDTSSHLGATFVRLRD